MSELTLKEAILSSSQKDALHYLSESGRAGRQARYVLGVIASSGVDGMTDKEGSLILEIPLASWIARRHDLIKRFPDLLFVDGKRKAASGILVDVWRCMDLQEVVF